MARYPPAGHPDQRAFPFWLRWLRRFVGWFLEHLYTDLAWAYDLVANLSSMGQWWTWQTAVDDALPSGPLLELAHGTGRLLRRQLKQGMSVIGLDLSPQMSRIASRRLAEAGLPRRLLRARAEALPFAEGSFRGAYTTFPSEFILDPNVVTEVLRVVADGGEFVVVPTAWITGRRPWDLVGRWLYTVTGQSPTDHRSLQWLDSLDLPGAELEWEIVQQPRADVLRLRLRAEGGPGAGPQG